MTEKTTILFRPVGQKELDLIEQSGFSAFPPRLEIQPIFYPVLNREYATQIARDWNTKDAASGYVGFVTKFHWIPAEKPDEFNENIVGQIKVIDRLDRATCSSPEIRTKTG